MKNFLLLSFFLLSGGLFAQRPASSYRAPAPSIKGKVTGRLVDAQSNEPLAFASVVLHEPQKEQNRKRHHH